MERVTKVIEGNTTEWSRNDWLEKKKLLRDCVWVEGAILKHEKSDFIYFAPFPTQIGCIYEITKESIIDAAATGKIISRLDKKYSEVRIYLKRDEVITKIEWRLAADLPVDIEYMSNIAAEVDNQLTACSQIDMAVAENVSSDGVKAVGASPTPTPTPTPTPIPRPGHMGVRG